MRRLLGFALVFCLSANGKTTVVGETYLAHTTGDELQVSPAAIHSWSFERNTCELWTERDGRILDPGGSVLFEGNFVSDVNEHSALVLHNSFLENRELLTGSLLATTELNESGALQRAVKAEGRYFLLFQGPRRLWVERRTKDLELEQSIVIAEGRDLWRVPKIVSAGNSIWVGFSVTSNSHAYSPVVARLDFGAKIQEFFSWPDKGLLFALAPFGKNVLASRDIPTAPFTLPIYTHVEHLAANSPPVRHYSAETNWFVDALAAEAETLWTAERSIHSGTGSRLRRHAQQKGLEKVWPLPEAVRDLCVTP
ncbi:MAG: hypothetical protein R3B54_12155 [Bdellovibrionota bacterium]